MQKLFDRLREPSSWAGLAAVIFGGGQLLKVNEAPAVADAVTAGGQAIAAGADPVTAGLMTVAGILAMILKERKDR